MAYPTIAVANAFIERAMRGQLPDLDPMKLQKLMFYAQSWHLKIYNEPLVDDFFAKWPYGPVIPSLYHEVKHYKYNSINALISNLESNGWTQSVVTPTVPASDQRTNELLDKICSVYGSLRATQLSYLTHQPGTAWSETREEGSVISNDLMKERIQ
ncbi:Panacea domain-containing protein [Serratia sp. 1D1416]|uniref:Panacea domain-containing protein n=1 Tax=Serratia sp. 1D1416 TaxID=2447890 RepID=UPI001013C341|nr:type II toxin-antitoxin system antitoxin SocA domain-containing protein [Serratia sp. 1D1416]